MEDIKKLQIEFISRIKRNEDKSNIDRLNIAFQLYYTLSKYKNTNEIDVEELLYKADEVMRGRSAEVSEWCRAQCLNSNYNDLKEISKYNVIKQSYSVLDLSLSDVYKTITKQHTSADIVKQGEEKYKELVERIKENTYDQYIKKRNKYNPDGSLNTFLSGEELEYCDNMSDEIIRTDPEIRSLNNANNKFASIHDTLTDRSIEMKYKFEKLKEQICNTARVTPESFDIFFKAIVNDQKHRMDTEVSLSGSEKIPTLYGGVADLYKVDSMEPIIKKHAHLLVDVQNDDKSKPIYVSDIIKVIDSVDSQDITRSHGNTTVKHSGYEEVWQEFNNFNQLNEIQTINRIQGKDLLTGINPEYTLSDGEKIQELNKGVLSMAIVKNNDKKWDFVKVKPNEANNTFRDVKTLEKDNQVSKPSKVTSLDDLI